MKKIILIITLLIGLVSYGQGYSKSESVSVNDLKDELKAEFAIAVNDVDFDLGIQGTKTLTEPTTLTFSNYIVGKTITLKIDGNFTLAFPVGQVEGDLSAYDGTMTNIIEIKCVDSVTPKFISGITVY